ncbi:hypothetical protein ACVW0A_004605 [Pseudomonas sp. TE3610]
MAAMQTTRFQGSCCYTCGRIHGVEHPVGAGSTREKNAVKYLKHHGAFFAGRARSHSVAMASTSKTRQTASPASRLKSAPTPSVVGAGLGRDAGDAISRQLLLHLRENPWRRAPRGSGFYPRKERREVSETPRCFLRGQSPLPQCRHGIDVEDQTDRVVCIATKVGSYAIRGRSRPWPRCRRRGCYKVYPQYL